MQPECLNRRVTERNFLNPYIYPSGSRGDIETSMATNFYEFMLALSFTFTENASKNKGRETFYSNVEALHQPITFR